MARGDDDPIIEALRKIQETQDQHGRELRKMHQVEASHATLIRALADELAHMRVEMAEEMARVRTLMRAASGHPAGRGTPDRKPPHLSVAPPQTPDA